MHFLQMKLTIDDDETQIRVRRDDADPKEGTLSHVTLKAEPGHVQGQDC